MPALPQRQDLVWLRSAAWHALADAQCGPGADERSAVLRRWARRRLPAVVTAQAGAGPGELLLGVPAPPGWGRQRLALRVPLADVARVGAFPAAARLAQGMPGPAGAALRHLAARLVALGAVARVFGSHGWQWLSALPCVHAGSDLDLLVDVADAQQADAAAALMAAPMPIPMAEALPARPRLDGELRFADGSAVAWREWLVWRQGRGGTQLLVRHRAGAALHADLAWLTEHRRAPPAAQA